MYLSLKRADDHGIWNAMYTDSLNVDGGYWQLLYQYSSDGP